jgi:hypothetical protein
MNTMYSGICAIYITADRRRHTADTEKYDSQGTGSIAKAHLSDFDHAGQAKNIISHCACAMLGIRYPIIQGAIKHAGGPGLVAAVSNSGGLGVLSSAGITTAQLGSKILKRRASFAMRRLA